MKSKWEHLVESDEEFRRIERAYMNSETPVNRRNYAIALRRAGRGQEANRLEGLALLNDFLSGLRWNRPGEDELTRIADHYTPDQIKEMVASNTPNRINLITADAVYHRTFTMADGSPRRYRANGKLRTWKTRPEDFRLPVMYGGFNRNSDSAHLTPSNADQFMLDPERA